MLFEEYLEPIQVWRLVSSGYLSDPTWTLITTVSGRFEPMKAGEESSGNQNFANVTEILFTPYQYRNVFQPQDGIVGSDGIQRRIVGQPELWKYMMPHVVCMLERAQWTTVS